MAALVVTAVLLVVAAIRAVAIVPRAHAANVERLGRYQRTLAAGTHCLIPFVDKVRSRIDLREQVVPLRPQPIVTADDQVVHIDTVLHFQVTDPRAAAYEISDYVQGLEQLTVTTLRNVVGDMDLESALASPEEIAAALWKVLDELAVRWGIRVDRVEIGEIGQAPGP